MNTAKKIAMLVLLSLGLGASGAFAADPTDIAGLITNVEAITGTATTAFIGAAALGLGGLTVGLIVYFTKKGFKLKG